jgi:thiol-disulfide isomerase/thioredoxin
MAIHPLDGIVHAPAFPMDLDWLNTDRPLTMSDLEGKIVLLDFWTYGCINCMHVLPDLKRLEQKYRNELVVIGIHSAKFTTEKETDAIHRAVQRYEIGHPVINDRNFQIWKAYNIQAWPTFMLINPTGRIVGTHSGEGIYPLFDPLIAKLIAHFDQKSILSRDPLNLTRAGISNQTLSFPGKIHASNDRLFISDSNHNRVLVTDLNGHLQDTIGCGDSGQRNGSFESASLARPQGLHLYGDDLYIADTENHLVRRADLNTRSVQTVLGTGGQAQQINQPGSGTSCAINSPWDLVVHDNLLYIAMAGAHQLWSADINGFHARPHAGSGREDLDDGPLLRATLAQPSGIVRNGSHLYFADSETSAIRLAHLQPSGHVETLVGEALFRFGDRDGAFSTVHLQHPMGLTHHHDKLYIADTYNHKIKILNATKKTVTTLAGSARGHQDGDRLLAKFNEPSGIAHHDNMLYIADTNNHAIRVVDLNTQTVSTLDIR